MSEKEKQKDMSVERKDMSVGLVWFGIIRVEKGMEFEFREQNFIEWYVCVFGGIVIGNQVWFGLA